MNEFPIDHAVVRWCKKREACTVWYPHQTIRPNMCPAKVVWTTVEGGIENTYLNLLDYEFTVNGEGFEHCELVFRQISGTRGWRLNSALEYAIRHGRTPKPQTITSTQGETYG